MLVRHLLSVKGQDIIAVQADTIVSSAASLLAERRIGAVLVLEADGAIRGILSERDLVRAIARDGAGALTKSVGHYMTREVATCSESDTVEQLMELMTRGRFRHVPVMSGAQLIGIVSIGDVVKSRIAETVEEAESLRAYISASI